MFFNKVLFVFFLAWMGLGLTHLQAQMWEQVISFASPQDNFVNNVQLLESEQYLISGTFSQQLTIGSTFIERDFDSSSFIVQMDDNGNLLNSVFLEGQRNESVAIGTAESKNINWVGEYWLTSFLEEDTLTNYGTSKSVFFCKLDSSLHVLQIHSIHGSGVKNCRAAKFLDNGDTYIIGDFSDTLFVDNTTLLAQADQSGFILKYNMQGQLVWSKTFGIQGQIWANALDVKGDTLVVGGRMYGAKIKIGNDTIQNNTNDSDGFVITYQIDGSEIKAHKIGGVNEQSVESVALAVDGAVWAYGSFFGLVRLEENLTFQSQNLQEDLFLVKYDRSLTPRSAVTVGGLGIELAGDLKLREDQIFISGLYREEFEWEGTTLSHAGNGFQSFFAQLNSDAQLEKSIGIMGTEQVFLSDFDLLSIAKIAIAGISSGNIDFGNFLFSPLVSSDGFISVLNFEESSNVVIPSTLAPNFPIFPNPFSHHINIEMEEELERVEIFNAQGQWINHFTENRIDTQAWTKGVYFIKIISKTGAIKIQKAIKPN